MLHCQESAELFKETWKTSELKFSKASSFLLPRFCWAQFHNQIPFESQSESKQLASASNWNNRLYLELNDPLPIQLSFQKRIEFYVVHPCTTLCRNVYERMISLECNIEYNFTLFTHVPLILHHFKSIPVSSGFYHSNPKRIWFSHKKPPPFFMESEIKRFQNRNLETTLVIGSQYIIPFNPCHLLLVSIITQKNEAKRDARLLRTDPGHLKCW